MCRRAYIRFAKNRIRDDMQDTKPESLVKVDRGIAEESNSENMT